MRLVSKLAIVIINRLAYASSSYFTIRPSNRRKFSLPWFPNLLAVEVCMICFVVHLYWNRVHFWWGQWEGGMGRQWCWEMSRTALGSRTTHQRLYGLNCFFAGEIAPTVEQKKLWNARKITRLQSQSCPYSIVPFSVATLCGNLMIVSPHERNMPAVHENFGS